MTTKEYLEHLYDYEYELDCIEFNKQLVAKYPWVSYEREWFWDTDTSTTGYYDNLEDTYRYTWLDSMEEGWRVAFADAFCEEIQKELERCNCTNQFAISELKEKYGVLHVYITHLPEECRVGDIIKKYQKISEHTCILCGEEAKYKTDGYILPVCDNCKETMLNDNPSHTFYLIDEE